MGGKVMGWGVGAGVHEQQAHAWNEAWHVRAPCLASRLGRIEARQEFISS